MNTKDDDNLWNIREMCGMVFQNPDNQLVATIVEEDVAFGTENLGVPREELRKRVDETLTSAIIWRSKTKNCHCWNTGDESKVFVNG